MSAAPAKWRRRVATLTAASIGSLALAEVALRVWEPFPRDLPWYPGDRTPEPSLKESTVVDPALGWHFAANAVIDDQSPEFHHAYRCNELGFREALHGASDAPNATHVAFVGDSFTFGIGVATQEIFVERLAAEHAGVRVSNFGMAGFGVDQMWRALVEVALPREPDVVVASFIVDDLTRSMTCFRYRNGWAEKPTYVLDDGELAPMTETNAPGVLSRFVEQRLYLAEAWRRASRKFGLDHGCGERFELNLRIFEAMHEACEARGSTLVVVHLPDRGAWKPLPAFAESLAELGVRYFDLGASSVSDPAALFYRKDPHFNAAGHVVAAREIGAYLEREGLIGGAAK
ncbi:MAG: hypothetical protein FJ294_15545 [Planctomycetes bacterium]|nr:hypothetical protein [Planctomycetota bacterium]